MSLDLADVEAAAEALDGELAEANQHVQAFLERECS